MFIETVPNRTSPPAILLRESYRDEAGKAQKRTLANLSKLPASLIAGLKGLLKGGVAMPTTAGSASEEGLRIERSLPHGHVAAGLGMLRKIHLDRLLVSTAKDEAARRFCDLTVGLIVDRLLASRSKLGFVRAINGQTASSSLGEVLSLGAVAEREVYAALDWLLEQQPRVESALARRHLKHGTLVLYDVSSSYLEGRKCPLAQHGYSRDHRPDRPQIVYGLLCTREGLPVAVEVFDGNTADPATLAAQIAKLKQRFALERGVLVGDRGMLTSARIREEVEPAGLDWISCLRSDAIQKLASDDGPLQLSLFDERDLAEISAPEQFPAERLPQPALGAGARAQARGSADGDRAGPGPCRRARASQTQPVARRGRDRPRRRRGGRQAQGRQTFPDRDRRGAVRLSPQARRHRARSPARRRLCRAHQRSRREARRRRDGPSLQGSGPGGARLPLPEDRRSRHPPDPPLDRRTRARPRLPVHARLSRRMASAPSAGSAAVP